MRQPIILVLLLAVQWASAQSNIVGYAYWFDQNNAAINYVEVTPGNVIDVLDPVQVAGLSVGTHYLYVRLKDASGQWSPVQWHVFAVEQPGVEAEVVGYEYWFDQNDADRQYMAVIPGSTIDVLDPVQLSNGLPVRAIAS